MSTTNGMAYQGANEFLNTFLMMFAYDESRQALPVINEMLEKYLGIDVDMNPYVKEGIESAEQLLISMGIMKLIQYEEKFLERVFEIMGAILSGLLLLSKKGYQKLTSGTVVGRKFKALEKFLTGVLSDVIEKAKMMIEWLKALISARSNSYQSGSLIQATQSNRNNVMERDRSAMMLADGMSKNIVNSLNFKLMTKSFRPSDEALLKKILGRDSVTELDVEDVNKIADAFYVLDNNGKITGVPELIIALLHGQGLTAKQAPTSL
jgi:hypothetical protein